VTLTLFSFTVSVCDKIVCYCKWSNKQRVYQILSKNTQKERDSTRYSSYKSLLFSAEASIDMHTSSKTSLKITNR